MTALCLWLLSFFAPRLDRLGADDWETRERETERCDCFALAVVLPVRHDDPEVDHRVRRLRARNLRWLSGRYVERIVLRESVREWARLYVAPNRSALARERDTFVWLHSSWPRAADLFRELPHPDRKTGFLSGTIVPGEYEEYLDYLDYHQFSAPHPRVVDGGQWGVDSGQ